MKHFILTSTLLASTLFIGCESRRVAAPNQDQTAHKTLASVVASETETVHEIARKMIDATYACDAEKLLEYTSPIVIENMGGRRSALEQMEAGFAKFKAANTTLEKYEFPLPPKFIEGDSHFFAVVPTLHVFNMKSNRMSSEAFVFGVRRKGDTKWTFIDGTKINPENVVEIFDDFPPNYEFPQCSMTNLTLGTPWPPKKEPSDSRSGGETPELALRRFLVSMAKGDLESIEQYCLPHPDLDILLGGEKPTDSQLKMMEEMFTKTPIKSFSVGESFSMPNGKKIEVTETMVSDERKLLSIAGSPAPLPVHLVGEYWKVDPDSIIIIRKTAAELMRKNTTE